jgi:hypothetical protein
MGIEDMFGADFGRIPEDLNTLDMKSTDDLKEYAMKFLNVAGEQAQELLEGMDIEWRELLAVGTSLIAIGIPAESLMDSKTQQALTLGAMFCMILGYIQHKDPEVIKYVREEMRQKLGETRISKQTVDEAYREWKGEAPQNDPQEDRLKELLKDIDLDLEL